jgi:hypothetical protein
MKTKFTKGEWKTINWNGTLNSTVMTSNESDIICETYYNKDSHIDVDEAEANAKLIAAAPDLLNAAILMKENGFQTPSNKDFDKLVKAIKKATS